MGVGRVAFGGGVVGPPGAVHEGGGGVGPEARPVAGRAPAGDPRGAAPRGRCRSGTPGPGPDLPEDRGDAGDAQPPRPWGSLPARPGPGSGLEDFQTFASTWAYRVDPDAADAAYRESTDDYFVQAAVTTGGVAVRGFLDPVAGECLISVLRAEIGVPAVTDTRGTPRRMHDALASVMNRALAGGRLGDHASVRPSLVVHVPYATLDRLDRLGRRRRTGRGERPAQPWRAWREAERSEAGW